MSSVVQVPELERYLVADWGPMQHVTHAAARLGPEGRRRVAARIAAAAEDFAAPDDRRDALRRVFSFLAQVEVIAIEVPLAAMADATGDRLELFERQLEDEVFHSLLFATLARRLGGLEAPVPEAERLLDLIRTEQDPRTVAVLLNAVAEAWIENLFEHAASWGVADAMFEIVLVDEARHVHEAAVHAEGFDAHRVEASVRAFESELFKLVQHPRVALPMLAAAGETQFRHLSASLLSVHSQALRSVGLEPDPAIVELEETLEEDGTMPWLGEEHRPAEVEPETMWRRTALEIWDVPRDPVMHGWFDVRVDHIPTRILTPVLVAAVGKVWAEYGRMNRYTWGGKVWKPRQVNVGVRVAVGDSGEALSTIVVPEADKRSLTDITRIIRAGVRGMHEVGDHVDGAQVDPDAEALSSVLTDTGLMRMVPPETVTCPVTVSNLGRAGLMAGFGSMPGALGQSVELVLGRVEKRPVWRGLGYWPTRCVTIGAGADHRVVDGNHCAEAVRRIEAALSPQGFKEIRARPDTLPPPPEGAEVDDVAMPLATAAGIPFDGQMPPVMMACKLPWWAGWYCWLLKK